MAVNTIRGGWIKPTQTEVRVRTALDLWTKIRKLNERDAHRIKIEAAYLELGDVLELLPPRYRIVLGGSIE